MNIPTIEMDAGVARRCYLDYKRSVLAVRCAKKHGRRDLAEHDAELMRAYQQLARGRRVVDFGAAVLAGGFDANGRPRIAVVCAEARRCLLYRPCYTRWMDFQADERIYRANSAPWRRVRVVGTSALERTIEGIAIVPSIPPRHRPARGDLRKYVILFEANWSAPPVDPYLLRRLSGRFGVIVAHWNLTELERAVLA